VHSCVQKSLLRPALVADPLVAGHREGFE
jgi:hypothetical protein